MPTHSCPSRLALHKRLAWIAVTTIGLMAGVPATASIASPPPSPTATPTVESRGGESVAMPKMRAWTYIVADADTGDVLGGRDWHWKLPPASTMKTLTALSLVNRLQLDSQYRARKVDIQAEGSKVGLKEGSSYRVRDLFDGMLMPSGNDAATALASAYGGMQPATQAMAAEAERLGATDTVAKNTSGHDEPGRVAPAYDLALILRESLKNPQLQEIYKQHHVDFPDVEPTEPGAARKTIRIWTENRFILNNYPGALGGKTGFTSQAGRTYVGAMERNGRKLIVAVMRSAESTERAVNRLFEWGFANYNNIKPVDKLVDPQPADETTPVAAASYDEQGNSNLPQVAVVESSSEGSGRTPLLVLIATAALGLGFVIWRRRHRGEFAPSPPDDAHEVDLRERDGSNLR